MERDQLTSIALKYLSELGEIPATSYYEKPVADYIQKQCADIGIETQLDRY